MSTIQEIHQWSQELHAWQQGAVAPLSTNRSLDPADMEDLFTLATTERG